MAKKLTEAAVEEAAIVEFKALGYSHRFGPEITAEGLFAERQGYGDVFLGKILSETLTRINPHLPAETVEDVVRQVTRQQHPSLVLNNRAFHRMVADGVDVSYRKDGPQVGDKCQLFDWDEPLRVVSRINSAPDLHVDSRS